MQSVLVDDNKSVIGLSDYETVMQLQIFSAAGVNFRTQGRLVERFPPGQAATMIIPKAILGCGLIKMTSMNVNKGSNKNCNKTPNKTKTPTASKPPT